MIFDVTVPFMNWIVIFLSYLSSKIDKEKDWNIHTQTHILLQKIHRATPPQTYIQKYYAYTYLYNSAEG